MADQWAQFEEVQGVEWGGFEEIQATPEIQSTPVEPQQEYEPSFLTKAEGALSSLKNLSVRDVGELAVQGVTGLGGMVVGGLSGLNEASGYVPGEPDGRSLEPVKTDPVGAIDYAQQALTYEPEGEGAIAFNEMMDKAFGAAEQAVFDASYAAGDTDDVLGATAAYTAIMALPAMLSRRATGSKSKKPTRNNGAASKNDAMYQSVVDRANELYTRADAAEGGVKAESFANAVNTIEKRLAAEGFAPELQPNAAAALNALKERAANNQTLKGVEVNRRLINNSLSKKSIDADDARMVGIVRDIYDDWMDTLGQKDMVFGDAKQAVPLYREARDLWNRKMKADEIRWAIERAGIRAGQFTGSGFDNALKTEFRQIAMNKNRIKRFNQAERKLINAIANGDTGQKIASAIGRFAMRGPVSMALTGGVGAALFGPAGVIGAAAVGEGGRMLSTHLRRRSANRLESTALQGPESN